MTAKNRGQIARMGLRAGTMPEQRGFEEVRARVSFTTSYIIAQGRPPSPFAQTWTDRTSAEVPV
jgi:hypothetical protein